MNGASQIMYDEYQIKILGEIYRKILTKVAFTCAIVGARGVLGGWTNHLKINKKCVVVIEVEITLERE